MSAEFRLTTLDLLRHGHCEGGEIFRGSTDVPLTKEGWQQMEESLSIDGHGVGPWQRVVSSSLQRCRDFAENLSSERKLPLSVHEELREIHFGDWEGMLRTQVEEQHGQRLSTFWRDPVAGTPPNGEPYLEFHSRVADCVHSLLDQHAGEHLLLISHGAVMRVIMCELLDMPYQSISKISVPYACMTRFRIYQGKKRSWAQLVHHRGD